MSEQTRLPVATWKLASREGWVNIDAGKLPRLTWVPCPPVFPEDKDRGFWAAEYAALWWRSSKSSHGKEEVDYLAAVLAAIHQDVYAAGHCHLALVHLPAPRTVALPVQIGVWAMNGGRDETLRILAHADDPEAIEPPIVEEFTTDQLGTGLKALHYRRGGPDGTRVDGYLNYAWRSERYQTDLRLFTFCDALSRLQRAMPDIDDLARAITIVPANGDSGG